MTTEAELCELSRKAAVAMGCAHPADYATSRALIGEMLEWLLAIGETTLLGIEVGAWVAGFEYPRGKAFGGGGFSRINGRTAQEALARLVVAVAEARNAKT